MSAWRWGEGTAEAAQDKVRRKKIRKVPGVERSQEGDGYRKGGVYEEKLKHRNPQDGNAAGHEGPGSELGEERQASKV